MNRMAEPGDSAPESAPRQHWLGVLLAAAAVVLIGVAWFGMSHLLFPVEPRADVFGGGFSHSTGSWLLDDGSGSVAYDMPVQVKAGLSPQILSVDDVPGLRVRGVRLDSPNVVTSDMETAVFPAELDSSTTSILFVFDFDDCSEVPATLDLAARFDGPLFVERSLVFYDIDSTIRC